MVAQTTRETAVMLIIDVAAQAADKHRELLLEAERERLAAQVPHPPSGIRRRLATACVRLASWLDGAIEPVADPATAIAVATGADRYVRPADSGASGWVAGAAGV